MCKSLPLVVAASVAMLILSAVEPLAGADGPKSKPPATPQAGLAREEDNPFGDSAAPANPSAGKQPSEKVKPAGKPTAKPEEAAKPAHVTGALKIARGKPASEAKASRPEGISAEEERIERALDQTVSIEAVDAPLDEIVTGLRREFGVNLIVDQKAISNLGVCSDAPITVKLADVTLRCAMEEILRPLEMACVIRGETLAVTSKEVAESVLVTRVYSIATLFLESPRYPAVRSNDLGDSEAIFTEIPANPSWGGGIGMGIGGGAGGGGGVGGGGGGMGMGMMNVLGQMMPSTSSTQLGDRRMGGSAAPDFDDLTDAITSSIEPTRWEQVGGPCSIQRMGDQLIVSATAPLHRKVDAFLKTLRQRAETRRVIRLEAHWLWLTEAGLASLLTQGEGEAAAGDVVSEAAWKTFLKKQKEVGDEAAPTCQAVLKCFDGQTISGVSGRQTRVIVSMIPVVGDDPAATSASASDNPRVGYQPVTRTIQEGAALEFRPIASDDRKDVLLDLRTRYVEREDSNEGQPPKPATPALQGGGQLANSVQAVVAAVDRPRIKHYRLETSLRVPAGQRVLIGGLTYGEPSGEETNLYLFVKVSIEEPPRAAPK